MRYYMKQHFMSIRQNFDIYNEQGEVVYQVRGKFPILRRKLSIVDPNSHKVLAEVVQGLTLFFARVSVKVGGKTITKIQQKLSFFGNKFALTGTGWTVEGVSWLKGCTIYNQHHQPVARIQAKVLAWSDTFEIEVIDETVNPALVLAVALAIDLANDRKQK